MSTLDPLSPKDYIIRQKKVRELLYEADMGARFLEAVNQKVINMLIEADNRRKINKRQRLFDCDL